MSMNRLFGSAVCCALLLGAVSSWSACGGDSGGGGDGDAPGDESTGPVAAGTITIKPSKVYTAWDGEHEFVVPVVAGVSGATWTASDPSAVSIETQADGGALIKVKKGGVPKVTVTAKSGTGQGTVEVFITQGTTASWEFGKTRYTNGVAAINIRLNDAGRPDFSQGVPSINNNASCNNCHGETAQFGMIMHTPEQIGRFTDEEVLNIFTMGMKPPGEKLRLNIPNWSSFHKWNMTEDEKKGILLYLRSLAPKGMGEFRLPSFDGGFRTPTGTGMTTTTDAGV